MCLIRGSRDADEWKKSRNWGEFENFKREEWLAFYVLKIKNKIFEKFKNRIKKKTW